MKTKFWDMNILKIFKKKESQKEEISASSAISNHSLSEKTKNETMKEDPELKAW